MAEPINLDKARKARDREAARTQAAANRVRFGRSKTEREGVAAERDRAAAALDAGRLRDDP